MKIISVKNGSHFFELGNNEFHGFQIDHFEKENKIIAMEKDGYSKDHIVCYVGYNHKNERLLEINEGKNVQVIYQP